MAKPNELRPWEIQQPLSPLTTVGLKPFILHAQKSNLADQEKTCLLEEDSQIHIKASSEAIHIKSPEGQFT